VICICINLEVSRYVIYKIAHFTLPTLSATDFLRIFLHTFIIYVLPSS